LLGIGVVLVFGLLFVGLTFYPHIKHKRAIYNFEKGRPGSVQVLIRKPDDFAGYLDHKADSLPPDKLYDLLKVYDKAMERDTAIPPLDEFSDHAHAVYHCEKYRYSPNTGNLEAALRYFPKFDVKRKLSDALFSCPIGRHAELAEEMMKRLKEDEIDSLIRNRLDKLDVLSKKSMGEMLGEVCEDIADEIYHSQSKFDEGVVFYSRAVSFDPTRTQAYFWLGRYNHDRDMKKAKGYYEKVVELSPQHHWGLLNLGDAKRELGDYKGALLDYDLCIEVSPTFGRCYRKRGLLKEVNLKDIEGAMPDYDKAIEFDSTDHLAYYYRGTAYHDKGDNVKAGRDFRKMMEIFEGDASGLRKHGLWIFNYGIYDQARPFFQSEINLGGMDNHAEYAFYYLCLTHIREGDADIAREKAAEFSKRPSAGKWQDQLRKFFAGGIAADELLKATESKDPKIDAEQKCEAYFYIAETRLAKGDIAGARDFFEKCIATEIENYIEYTSSKRELPRVIPFLGISHETIDNEIIITEVVPGSGAEKAGIKLEDCLLSIGGTEIKAKEDVSKGIRKHNINDEVAVIVRRDGIKLILKATLGKRK
jgi:tetratricopeptide (TPR) repeat protein